MAVSSSAQVTTLPKQGIRENDPRVHALTNARIIAAPGKTIEKGTVLIRDGIIVEVGPEVDGKVRVLSGLKPGEKIVTEGAIFLKKEMETE